MRGEGRRKRKGQEKGMRDTPETKKGRVVARGGGSVETRAELNFPC